MESVEELRRALEAAQAETAALRAAAEGADWASRVNDTGDADEADSAYRATTMMGMLGRELIGMLDPTQDKVRIQQFFSAAVEIVRSLNSQRIKMKPRCGVCVLGPIWMT